MYISVVVPAYNAERFLHSTLSSVACQTFSHFECIVVDDGSTDATAEIAASFCRRDPRFHLLQQPNAGLGAARNAGIAASNGSTPYLWPLDADDVLHPHAMETLLTAIEKRPDAVGAYGWSRYVDEAGHAVRHGEMEAWCATRKRIRNWRVESVAEEEDTDFSTLLYEGVIQIGCAVLRRSTLEQTGLFHLDCKGREDYDLFLRMSSRGPFVMVPEVLLDYRRHSGNMSSDTKLMDHSLQVALRRAVHDPVYASHQRALAVQREPARKLEEAEAWRSWALGNLSRGRLIRFVHQWNKAYAARRQAEAMLRNALSNPV
jgi:glycosyltransferase involved in cell wall biosynthesis